MTTPQEVRRNLMLSIMLLLILFIVGIYFYHEFEGWNYLDTIYFMSMTITTVGFGDIVPQTDLGKIFTVLVVWIGISIAFFFIYSLAAYRESTIDKTFDKQILERLRIMKNIALAKEKKEPPSRRMPLKFRGK